jgi:hypothetical protein
MTAKNGLAVGLKGQEKRIVGRMTTSERVWKKWIAAPSGLDPVLPVVLFGANLRLAVIQRSAFATKDLLLVRTAA